jgi:hypothetical protein
MEDLEMGVTSERLFTTQRGHTSTVGNDVARSADRG